MFKGTVMDMRLIQLFHLRRSQLAVLMGYRKDFMSKRFHSACLMNVDMAAPCRNHSLVGTKRRINHCHIGLGSSYQKMYGKPVISAGLADELRCPAAVRVFPVTGGLLQIRFHHSFHNPGMRAFVIVTLK